jgi:hypothetical protein
MSLPLVDYASSDDASEDEQAAVPAAQRGAETAENKRPTQLAGNAAAKPSKLPSAAEMLGSKAKSSSMVAPSAPAAAPAAAAAKAAAKSEQQAASASSKAAEKPAAQGSKMFVPPQMKRPNKVTEDIAAWTTQRKHRSSGQETEQSSKRPKAEAKS